jgi:DNA-binding transcriptional ArsR family regulator
LVTDGGDDDRVFKALADPTRRFLLDRLFARDGRTLTELESELEMTRFGVMKHLKVLEEAGLVVTRRHGPGEAALPQRRPDPADPRPVDRQVHRTAGLGAGRPEEASGGRDMTTATSTPTDDTAGTRTVQVHRVYIAAPRSGCGTRC